MRALSRVEQAAPEMAASLASDMTLELEGRAPDWQVFIAAADKTGVTWTAPDAAHDGEHGLVRGCFTRSLMHFRVEGGEGRAPRQPMAQGQHGCDFLTRYTLVFCLNPGRHEDCRRDLKIFLTALSQLTPMQFVLSSRYQDVHALRDLRRFEWLWEDSRRAL